MKQIKQIKQSNHLESVSRYRDPQLQVVKRISQKLTILTISWYVVGQFLPSPPGDFFLQTKAIILFTYESKHSARLFNWIAKFHWFKTDDTFAFIKRNFNS